MNMISTGAFLNEVDGSDKQKTLLVKKLVSAWEQKNSKTARAGGVSLLALSLAACGSSDDSSDAVSYTQAQLDAAKAAATATAEAAAATAQAAAVAAVDITTDNDSVASAATSLALRNAAAEAGAVTFDGQSDAALIAAIKSSDNAGLADAAVVALSATDSAGKAITTLAALDTAYEALANPVVTDKSLVLTKDLDQGSGFTGGTGTDSFSGTLTFTSDALTAAATMTAGDTLDGGDGTDTLQITVTGAAVTNAGEIVTPTLSNVEKVHVRSFETDASGVAGAGATIQQDSVEIDLSNSTGITEIGTTASNNVEADVVFANVTGMPNVVMAGKGDLRVEIASGNTGSSDEIALTLNDVGTAAGTRSTFSVNAVETLNITSSTAANFFDVADAAFTKVDVGGTADLTIDVLDTGVTVFDASDASGAINADLSAITIGNLTSVIGGSGSSDTVTISAAVTVDATPTNTLSKFSGFETLAVNAAVATALSADTMGITDFDFKTATSNQTLTLNSGYTSATTVSFEAGDTITNSANVALTGSAVGAALASGSTFTGGTGTDTLNITADGATTTIASTVTGVEVMNIAAAATASTTINLVTDNANIASAKAMTVDASALTDSTAVFTFDASAELDGTYTVTGGAAADVFTAGTAGAIFNGGAGGDTLTGGAGNDTLNGGAGKDTITLNAGVDTVDGGDADDIIVAAGNLTSADTIDGGAGKDTLRVTSVDATALSGVTNVETLQVNGSASVSLSSNLAFTTIDLTDGATTEALTLASGYTQATTVKIDQGDDITNTAADAVITVEANASHLEAADNSTLAGSDKAGVTNTLTITNDAAATVDLQTDISNFDVINVVDNTVTAGIDITFDLTSYGTDVTIDVSALDSGEDSTVTGTSSNAINYTGGGGVDTVIMSSAKNDTLSLGAGKDVITAGTDITYQDTIDGGDGVDTMSATSLADVDLQNVTNVENLTIDNTSTLGAYASAAGVVQATVTGGDNVSAAAMTTGITFVADSTVSGASDTLTGGSGDDVFQFTGLGGLNDGDTINGTSGTDTIQLNNTGRMIAGVDIDDISNIDTMTAKDADGLSTTQNDSITINIVADASATAHTFTIDMSAITDGNDDVIMTQAGTTNAKTAYVVTGGAGDDTLITSAAVDTVKGGSGADKIDAGGAADTITGGGGADVFQFSSADAVYGSEDTITDFTTGSDKIEVNMTLTSATFVAAFNKSATGVNMASYLTSANDGEAIYDAANTTLIVDLNGDAALGGNDLFIKSSGEVKATDVVYNLTSAGATVETITLHDSSTTSNGDDRYILNLDIDSVTGAVDNINNWDETNDILVFTGTENTADDFKAGIDANDYTGALLEDADGDGDSLAINLYTDTSSTAATVFDGDNYQLGMTGDVMTMAATSEVTGGNHADFITAGATSAGITGGKGSDVITGAGGTDTIIMTGGAGNGVDQISTFTTTTDLIHLDNSDLVALSSVTAMVNLDGTTVTTFAATAVVFSGTTKVTDLANATGDELLQINGDYSSAEAVETALETGGDHALTVNGTIMDAGDAFLAIYDDGINSTLAVVATSAAVANDAEFAAGTITVTDIATFMGIADAGSATTLATADVVVIA
jgi:hypothetical protein